MAEVAARAERLEHVQRFESLGGRATAMRSRDLGLKLVASGLRRRRYFCELTGSPNFRPSGDAVLAR